MKKFYKDEDGVDEDEGGQEAGAEKVQGTKEVEDRLGELGGAQKETAVVGGESVSNRPAW